jgi:hypothetical protein
MSLLENYFINIDPTTVEEHNITQLGVQVDWFSSILGRYILHGTVTFQATQNYKSNAMFESFKQQNALNIPCTIILLDDRETYSGLDVFTNMREFMMGAPEERFMLFGFVKGKNKKKPFKFHKQKRFFIPISSAVVIQPDSAPLYYRNFRIATTIVFPDSPQDSTEQTPLPTTIS